VNESMLVVPPIHPRCNVTTAENEPLCLGPNANVGHAFAVTRPLPPAPIARTKAAGPVEVIDVERAPARDCVPCARPTP
jgi:hypothetical protein